MNKPLFMKPIRSFLFVVCAASLLLACNKSGSDTPKTNTELIAQSSWKFDHAMVGGSDVSSLIQACQKDNVLSFSSMLTGSVDEGATKCNSGDPQQNPFTWNFASNETILHISTVLFTGGSSDFTLVTLSDTQLVVSQNVNIAGTSQNAVISFIH
jgi:hypothetical protein